jgi:hypothetical protein
MLNWWSNRQFLWTKIKRGELRQQVSRNKNRKNHASRLLQEQSEQASLPFNLHHNQTKERVRLMGHMWIRDSQRIYKR